MKKYRLVVFLLAVLLLVIPLASCQGKNENPSDTERTGDVTKKSVETDDYGQELLKDGVPEGSKFGGKQITILVRRDQSRYGEWYTTDAELQSGKMSALQQGVYQRNEKIQEDLDVIFDFRNCECADGKDLNDKIRNAWLGEDSPYDIVNNKQYHATEGSLMGIYMNLYDPALSCLQLDHPYWNQTYIDAAEVFGQLYTIVGDVNLSVYMCMFAMYFNKPLLSSQGFDEDDLYQTVLDYQWTWDYFASLVKNLAINPNADDPSSGLYGFYSHSYSHAYDGLMQSLDCGLIYTDPDDGTHSLVAGGRYQKALEMSEKIAQLYSTSGVYLDKAGTAAYGEVNIFVSNAAVFSMEGLNDAGTKYKGSKVNDYGLLPLPMYNEAQHAYYTGVQDSHNAISVPKGNKKNYTAISAVLERMSSSSYSTVRPYYVDTLVRFQYLQDSKSGQVLDLLLGGAKWDFSTAYASGTAMTEESVDQAIFNRIWRAGCSENSFAIRFAKYKDAYNELIAKLDNDLRKLQTEKESA